MRIKLGNWTRLAVVVVAMAGTQAGCKSGWKMPGSDMFPWSKKPTESTLAGSSPGLSMPSSTSTSPVGPSYKNTPSTLAGNGSSPNKPVSPYGAGATGPSFNMPSNNPMASNSTPGMSGLPNAAGVSAGANGYTTGSYNMGGNLAGNAGRPGFPPPTGYGTTPPSAPSGGYGSIPTQTAVANNLPAPYGGAQPAGFPQQANSSAYSPVGNVPAMNASYNAGGNLNAPPQSSMPNALGNSYPPSAAPSAPSQTYTGAAPYRPGSVGRQTSYDFSNQGAGGAGLPPAGFPTTATGPQAGPIR